MNPLTKRFFKDSAIYSLGPILTRGIQVILLPIYTRQLAKAEYGIYDILLIVQSLVNVTIAMEITQGFARYYSDAKTEEEKVLYSSTSFWFVLIMYAVFLCLSLFFSDFLSRVIVGQEYSPKIFQFAMISTFGSGVLLYLQNQLRFYLKSKLFVLVGIVFTIISSVSTIILLVVFKAGIMGVIFGLVLGYAAAIFLSWYFSRSNYKPVFNWEKLKEMLKFSIPLIPASIGTIVLNYIDRIAIRNLMSLDFEAVFGRAYSFASMINIVLVGFQTALLPLIYQNYKASDTPKQIAKIFRYFLVVSFSVVMALSIFSIEALKVFTTPAYFGATKVIPIISFATLFLSMQIFTPGLQIAKKTKTMASINIFAAILNTILCFALIPVFGIIGASLATLISATLILITNMYYSQKLFYIPHQWKRIIPAFIFPFIFVSLMFTFGDFSGLSLFVKNIIKAVLWLISASIIVKILIGKDELKEIIKQSRQILKSKLNSIFR